METDTNIIEVIQSGGSILYPTETVWGIGCDARNNEAVEQIYRIKDRDKSKSLIALVCDIQMLEQYVGNLSNEALNYLQSERPTTIIFEKCKGIAENAKALDASMAFRIIDKEHYIHHIIKSCKCPLISTSANTSGNPTPTSYDEIEEIVKQAVDVVVNPMHAQQMSGQSSRIIKLLPEGKLEIIRD